MPCDRDDLHAADGTAARSLLRQRDVQILIAWIAIACGLAISSNAQASNHPDVLADFCALLDPLTPFGEETSRAAFAVTSESQAVASPGRVSGSSLRNTITLPWLEIMALQGDAVSQRKLGFLYQAGDGVPQDRSEAVRWSQKAADQGDSYAQNEIGAFYDVGFGVQRDIYKATLWYCKAANQGNPYAQGNIGGHYEAGYGVGQDYADAVSW